MRPGSLVFVPAIVGLALAACSPAKEKITELTASNAVMAAPHGASGVTAAYVTFISPLDDRIIGVSSPQARAVEMHEMKMAPATDDKMPMMQMRKVDGVDLPAGQSVRFQQGGLHIMVFDPAGLRPGATFPIVFQLKSGTTKMVQFSLTAP